jgi:hypothetical protein
MQAAAGAASASVPATATTTGSHGIVAPPLDHEPSADEPLPPGHPQTGAQPGADPHSGEGPRGARTAPAQGPSNGSALFEPPPDTVEEDPRLPAGTIQITIVDGDNRGLPRVPVTLGMLHQSIAKGESRERITRETDDSGVLTFPNLDTASNIAYRVTVARDPAIYSSSPFQLNVARGTKVALHVYPATRNLQDALIVVQNILHIEVKDDRIQLHQGISIFNLGRVAWVPDDVVIALPENFTALSANQSMGDQGVDGIDKRGAKLRGTFGPGRQDVEFRWQLPYSGESTLDFETGVPPHAAVTRVMAVAAPKMKLSVDGFPEPQPRNDAQGQRVLVTERQLRRDEAPQKRLRISLRDIPDDMKDLKRLAAALAGMGLFAGLAIAIGGARKGADTPRVDKGERGRLLEELEQLERAHRTGQVGPKTYERTRRALIDSIARTLTPKAKRGPIVDAVP